MKQKERMKKKKENTCIYKAKNFKQRETNVYGVSLLLK